VFGMRVEAGGRGYGMSVRTGSTRFCLECGYPLAGLPSRVCPECGRAFDRDDSSTYDTAQFRHWQLVAIGGRIMAWLALMGGALLVI